MGDETAAIAGARCRNNMEGKLAVKLRWIDSNSVSNHDLAELPKLRRRTDGFLWLDIQNGATKPRRCCQATSAFSR
jgi:hypothetical protein